MSNATKLTFWQAAAKHQDTHSVDLNNQLGQIINRNLRRAGYLAALKININGTIGVTTGTAPDADTLTNFIPFIGLKSPQGAYLQSTSLRALIDLNYRLKRGVSPISDPSYLGINAGATSTQNVNINVIWPMSLNLGINVETGLLLRQLANNDFTVEMRCATNADLAGSGTVALANPNLNITLEEIWFEAVDENEVEAPDFSTFVRIRDQLILNNVAAGFANDVNYPVGPVVLDAQFRVTENGVAAHGHVASIGLMANTSNQVFQRNGDQIRFDNYSDYGKAFRNGVFLLQFVDDGAGVNESRMRDWINSAAATSIDWLFNTASAFNSANSNVLATYRELVPLTAGSH